MRHFKKTVDALTYQGTDQYTHTITGIYTGKSTNDEYTTFAALYHVVISAVLHFSVKK